MVTTQIDREEAFKIVAIYNKLRIELENIEDDLNKLNLRKNQLLEHLENTRAHERELIDRIKLANPDQEFNVLDLVKIPGY